MKIHETWTMIEERTLKGSPFAGLFSPAVCSPPSHTWKNDSTAQAPRLPEPDERCICGARTWAEATG